MIASSAERDAGFGAGVKNRNGCAAGAPSAQPARAAFIGKTFIFLALGFTFAFPTIDPAWSQSALPNYESGEVEVAQPLRTSPVPSEDVGAPTSLAPPGEARGGVPPGDPGEANGAAVQREGLTRQGIEIDRLDSLPVESTGLLDSANGGLGAEIWSGSRRETLLDLIARLPDRSASPALGDLVRRLLLTNAVAPAGGNGPDLGERPSLLEERARALFRLGALDDVAALLRIAPQRLVTPELAQLRVESLLLEGEMAEACPLVEGWVTATPDLVFWQKALAVCQLEEGEKERAALTASLLRESGAEEDALFVAFVADGDTAALSDGLLSMESSGESPSPVDLVLLRRASLVEAPPFDPEAQSLGLLRGLSRLEGLSPEIRAAAEEDLVAAGLPFAEALRESYLRFSFTEEELDGAASRDLDPPAEDPLRERALMFQAARRAEQAVVRAEVLRVALDRAGADGAFLLMAEVLRPLLTTLPPRQEVAWFCGTAVRALYALGEGERAAEWLTLARQEAILSPETAASLLALWPYARLYDTEAMIPNAGLHAWRSARADPQRQTLAGAQTYVQALLQGLGEVEPSGWSELVLLPPGDGTEAPDLPPAPIIFALEEASQGGRRGESVLLSAIALGEGPLARSHPLVLNRVLAALDRVGLREEARLLAGGALLQGGI